MGFRFRRSIKIAPGVRINLGKKGFSSVSVGPRGAKVTLGKKGVRNTVGIPGTGLSYTQYKNYDQPEETTSPKANTNSQNFCSNCGHRIYKTWMICPYCMNPLTQEAQHTIENYIELGRKDALNSHNNSPLTNTTENTNPTDQNAGATGCLWIIIIILFIYGFYMTVK